MAHFLGWENSRGKRLTVLLDSNMWIEYFEGSTKGEKVREYVESEEKIIVSTINIAEVFRQMLQKKGEASAKKVVAIMTGYAFAIPVTTEIALAAAALKHQHKLGLGDSIIYATAKMNHAMLVTGDSDFKGMTDVIVLGM